MAKSSRTNILVNALAGAAKTTTLALITDELRSAPILSVAFNKRIAEEMSKRLGSHVKCATLNSVGHRAWAGHTKRKLTVDSNKTKAILKDLIDASKGADRQELYESFSPILKAVSAAKIAGYVPAGIYPDARRLITAEAFEASLNEAIEDDFPMWAVNEILATGIRLAYAGTIDFDDQIYMPTLFGGEFPQFPIVMVDEAQDLSSINHAMLEKLVAARLIAVGDPYQSIYAFRGADTRSMARLREAYNMTEMTLSTSFRCPKRIVERARFRAPHMQAAPWAIEGEVNTMEEWNASQIPDGSAIICRNNAPLYRTALSLLRYGRGVKLLGTDLGPSLTKTLKKLGPESSTSEHVMELIDAWEAERLRKRKGAATVKDKAECLRVFASFGKTLSEAIAYAEHLFAAAGPINLMSGHKSKGLEFDTVYHLDPHRIPSPYAESLDEQEQELNVRYVIETRPKAVLNLVTMEGLRP